jgi:hypothetical protein
MNKQNAKEYLPLVQALADGKTIQLKINHCWEDLDCPTQFRIKPEPRRAWAAYIPTQSEPAFVYWSRPIKTERELKIVEFIEVLK